MRPRLLLVAAVVGQCACGSSSTAPTAPVVGGPAVTGVGIAGPAALRREVGDIVQLTASVSFSPTVVDGGTYTWSVDADQEGVRTTTT